MAGEGINHRKEPPALTFKSEPKDKTSQGQGGSYPGLHANVDMSTHSDCGKDDSHNSSFDRNEVSSDLTASDFEVLNSENFFERINEAFQNF